MRHPTAYSRKPSRKGTATDAFQHSQSWKQLQQPDPDKINQKTTEFFKDTVVLVLLAVSFALIFLALSLTF